MKKYLYLLAALLLTSMSFCLTSCDDDDDDGGDGPKSPLVINGKGFQIKDVNVGYHLYNGVKCYAFYFYYENDGTTYLFLFDTCETFLGKTHDLAKEYLSHAYYNDVHDYDNWWTAAFWGADGAEEWDDMGYAAGFWYNAEGVKDEDPSDFKSGTFYAQITEEKLTLKAQFETKNGSKCSLNYDGEYTLDIWEGPEVKAEFPVQRIWGNKK